jgi:hypothetical protein
MTMAKKKREPRDSQMDLARRADARRRYSEEGPSGMTFSEAQTPIRFLASKLMEGRDRRAFERNQPKIRAEAADLERQMTDSLSRPRGFENGGMVRGTRPVQVSGKNFSGNF